MNALIFGVMPVLLFFIVLLLLRINSLNKSNGLLRQDNKTLSDSYGNITGKYDALNRNYSEEIKKARAESVDKSRSVIKGQITEQLAPLLSDKLSSHSLESFRFLGQPVDFILFGEDDIIFVEIKSGGSKLTKKQIEIRKMVEAGKVKFEVVRI